MITQAMCVAGWGIPGQLFSETNRPVEEEEEEA